MSCGIQTPGHLILGGLVDGLWLLLPSTLLVMQHFPCPGHSTLLSISSHNKAKNPVTQVPLQSPLLFFLGGEEFFFGLLVVVVVVVVVLSVVVLRFGGSLFSLGMMSCGGTLPPKTCLATQHLRLDLQRPSMSRMASQKPESRSATQTPGHVSARQGGSQIVFFAQKQFHLCSILIFVYILAQKFVFIPIIDCKKKQLKDLVISSLSDYQKVFK